jgi:hypothetical protein
MLIKGTPRRYITATEAAKILSYKSSITVKRLREAGKIKGYKNSDAGPTTPWMFIEAEIKAYKKKRFAVNGEVIETAI